MHSDKLVQSSALVELAEQPTAGEGVGVGGERATPTADGHETVVLQVTKNGRPTLQRGGPIQLVRGERDRETEIRGTLCIAMGLALYLPIFVCSVEVPEAHSTVANCHKVAAII